MIKSIKITKKNYLDFSSFALKRLSTSQESTKKSFIKSMMIGFFIAVFFMSVAINIGRVNFSSFHLQTFLMTMTMTMTLIFILFSGFIYNLINIRELSVPNEGGIIIGDKNIELTEEGIHEVNPFGSCFYKWEAVESVEDNCGDVYIFVDKLAALIIPSDSFESQIEEEKLVLLIKKYALKTND
ncbi:YcxB family protein [Vibrio splendidus]|uniref:YcxB family protein n=1 Tax=Vibrio splendidus TaxID=29497 RepID=UPI0021BD9D3D|nr:YcxB family protein [Vibrio splendidus]